jgi:hypothetical protein
MLSLVPTRSVRSVRPNTDVAAASEAVSAEIKLASVEAVYHKKMSTAVSTAVIILAGAMYGVSQRWGSRKEMPHWIDAGTWLWKSGIFGMMTTPSMEYPFESCCVMNAVNVDTVLPVIFLSMYGVICCE